MKDELIGEWTTNDSSGMFRLFGVVLVLDENGGGSLSSWGSIPKENGEGEEPYEHKEELSWYRVGPDRIKIKRAGELNHSEIKYKITEFEGPYKQLLDKLTEPGHFLTDSEMPVFWNIPGELYRKRMTND